MVHPIPISVADCVEQKMYRKVWSVLEVDRGPQEACWPWVGHRVPPHPRAGLASYPPAGLRWVWTMVRLVEVEAVGVRVQVRVAAAVQQAYKSQVGEMGWILAAPVGSAFVAVE